MRIPSEEWKISSIQPSEITNRSEKEELKEIIEVVSEVKVLKPNEKTPAVFFIKTPTVSGNYQIAFCVKYADGREVCPRISWVKIR